MVARNILLIVLVIGIGVFALLIFLLSYFKGLFDHPERQAFLVFDELDLRWRRPWENSGEQQARREAFGELVPPQPGEWGEGE